MTINSKRTAALLLCLLTTMLTFAAPITREQARQKAAQFLKDVPGKAVLTAVTSQKRLAPKAGSQEAEPYYVFDRGEDDGYVIVSGDDQTVEILGYTDHGTFDYTKIPANMKVWLDSYASQIKVLQSRPASSNERKGQAKAPAKAVTHPRVEQLMTCTWSQGDPYNQSCPMYFSLGRSVTGCVATAMAQILYYHREKSVTETQAAMPGYTTRTSHPTYGNLKVDGIPAGSPIDWANMKDNYGSATNLQKKAVADLMHYCGVAVKMDYTNSASAAYINDVYTALKTYFGYGSSVRYVSYADITTDAAWDNLIYGEIAAARPVYLGGSNSEGGHAFVTDGYDGNQHFHINWGWGGLSDGYYLLTSLTPGQQGIGGSNDGYNAYREVIVGIEPENFGAKTMSFSDATVSAICLANWDADGNGKLTYNEAAAVTDLGTALSGKTIKKFPELYYFTGLTKIADDAFNGCSQLTTLRLPKSLKSIGARAFKDCSKLEQLLLPTGVTVFGEDAFNGCSVLETLELPSQMTVIEPRTFKGCAAFTSVKLPIGLTAIGDEAFSGCTRLKSVESHTYQPSNITMGSDVFSGIDLTKATITTVQGTKAFFSTASQWSDFGSIVELRELSGGKFVKMETGKKYFIYNLGMGKYLTKGEAWGTQAIVGDSPMRFTVNRSNSMPEGTYYLKSEDTERSGKYLFRTSDDDNVGKGVMAAFVDGASLSSNNYWTISETENSGVTAYTFQIPQNGAGYKEGLYWGVQTDHQSNAALPTYGVYSDVDYSTHKHSCQWCFVPYDENEMVIYQEAKELENLINLASKRNMNVTTEQAVYDNLESTLEDIINAQHTLRTKLKFIDFADATVGKACIGSYDLNGDGEVSISEAASIADFELSFQRSSITSFDELQYFSMIPDIYGNTFDGCSKLESVVIPNSVTHIYYQAFRNCKSLETINIPELVTLIGANCFDGCTALKSVSIANPDPDIIELGTNIFRNVNLAACTLYVPFGSKEAYSAADVWKDFGSIVETRMNQQPKFSAITVDEPGYLLNLGTRKMVAKGEAYGTQAVVSQKGMQYQFKRTANMADDVYYLFSTQTGADGKVLFRTNTDSKVGDGVKTCFVDGSLSAKAYWKTFLLEETAQGPVYVLQVPETDKDFVEDEYLGTNESHRSSVASPTFALYYDGRGTGKNCQWAFIKLADMDAANSIDQIASELLKLLMKAKAREIDAVEEQAVYDNEASTTDELQAAVRSMRQKLHLINFADTRTKSLCLSKWDADGDDELSESEAASVTGIGETFRENSLIKSFDELRYFTALTEIPENAFRNCTELVSIYFPEKVNELGKYSLVGCNAMKYLVLLNADSFVPMGNSGVGKKTTVFVPASQLAAYQADAEWNERRVVEYTGKPIVTALAASRIYGRTTAQMGYVVTGAPIDGEPELTCEEVSVPTTPVGSYPITVTVGTITTPDVQLADSLFFVTPAPLTITAKSYSREYGLPNPEFEVTYKGFRNRENESVLDVKPVVVCDATEQSPVGEYEIRVMDAEAHNYEITYVYGKLIVTESQGISTIRAIEGTDSIYDLQGRRIAVPRQGLYIKGGKKIFQR